MVIDRGNTHPTEEQLGAFGNGTLPDTQAQRIEDHLQTCGSCVKLLEELVDDPFVKLLRESPTQRGNEPSADIISRNLPIPVGYELLEPLGRGGMGVVFKARQLGLGRLVALKQIRAGLDASGEERRRFLNEVEAVARLQHPNIVQIFDVGERDGAPYFAMEYLSGGTLATLLGAGPMRPLAAARLIETLARAIQKAHESGIIHRDLKPANVLLGDDGTPKIADFGLAKRLDVELGQTNTGALLGTPSYMSPEQAEGKATAAACDIYALGVILYETLTGRAPFQAATPFETLEQVRTCEPPAPSKLQPGVPRDLQTICLKCLQKEPRKRYVTAELLAEDCARFLSGIPVLARPVGRFERLWKWTKRNPYRAALATTSTVAALGVVAGLVWHQGRLQVEIEKTNAAARQALGEAQRADSNYREARETIQRMVAHFDGPGVANVPGIRDLRRRQVEEALTFFQGVLEKFSTNDATVRLDNVQSLTQVATMQVALGRTTEALQSIARAIELAEGLVAERPEDIDALSSLMTALQKQAYMRSGDGSNAAVVGGRKALAIAEALSRKETSNTRRTSDLAWCEHNLASAFLLAGDAKAAEPHARRAIELYQQIFDGDRTNHRVALELSESVVNLGLVLGSIGDTDAAESNYERANALLLEFPTGESESQHVDVTRGQLAVNWGNLVARTGRPEDAIAIFDGAEAGVERVLKLEPNAATARETSLLLHASRAQVEGGLARHEAAIADWRKVVELAAPGKQLEFELVLALELAAAGKCSEAVKVAEAAASRLDDMSKGVDLYNIACVYGRCLNAMGGLADTSEDLDARVTAYRQRALYWLSECRRKGFLNDPINRSAALADTDLAALQVLDEFKELLTEKSVPSSRSK